MTDTTTAADPGPVPGAVQRPLTKRAATSVLAAEYLGPLLHAAGQHNATRTHLADALTRVDLIAGPGSASRLALETLGYTRHLGLASLGAYRSRMLLTASRRAALSCLRANARTGGAIPGPERAVAALPTAKGFLPVGTPAAVCVDYNRACKTARIALVALRLGYGPDLTDDAIDACADAAGAHRPNSEATRQAVRAALYEPIGPDSGSTDTYNAVMDAAAGFAPLPVVTYEGRRVLMVPLPIA